MAHLRGNRRTWKGSICPVESTGGSVTECICVLTRVGECEVGW